MAARLRGFPAFLETFVSPWHARLCCAPREKGLRRWTFYIRALSQANPAGSAISWGAAVEPQEMAFLFRASAAANGWQWLYLFFPNPPNTNTAGAERAACRRLAAADIATPVLPHLRPHPHPSFPTQGVLGLA